MRGLMSDIHYPFRYQIVNLSIKTLYNFLSIIQCGVSCLIFIMGSSKLLFRYQIVNLSIITLYNFSSIYNVGSHV